MMGENWGGAGMEREILLLGDPRLYEVSQPVSREELEAMKALADDLRDTLYAFRRKYGVGRAIAAPQIGVAKRMIYMETGEIRTALVNPRLSFPDGEKMTLLDDCMSFPNLLVRVERHRRCRVDFLGLDWASQSFEFEGDLSELIQHEYDHLDGVLATMSAVDDRAFSIRQGRASAGEGGIRYRHTNLVARDWQRLSAFYQRALGLAPTGQTRDISAQWLERLTGIPGAHIQGEHLRLPGTDVTLEIFGYNALLPGAQALNRTGFAHIAFEVDDVDVALERVIAEGGGHVGEPVSAPYPGGVTATFVYATDPEGNLIELQSWKRQGN
jgi:peptide deformylase